MQIDIEPFEPYCRFGDERVYVLVALARSKENEGVTGPQPAIREVLREPADLRRKTTQLVHAVSRFEATYRLYLTANARNVTTAFFELRRSFDDWLEQRLSGNSDVLGKFERVDSEFKSVLMRDTCRDDTRFIFDLDGIDRTAATQFREQLSAETTVHLQRSTPNGFHIVCDPFDYTSFDASVEYELKTDGLVFVSMAAG